MLWSDTGGEATTSAPWMWKRWRRGYWTSGGGAVFMSLCSVKSQHHQPPCCTATSCGDKAPPPFMMQTFRGRCAATERINESCSEDQRWLCPFPSEHLYRAVSHTIWPLPPPPQLTFCTLASEHLLSRIFLLCPPSLLPTLKNNRAAAALYISTDYLFSLNPALFYASFFIFYDTW